MKFLEKLKRGTVLLDGGMGTYYLEKFGRKPECCEFANLQYPDRIEGIHREYISAGCDAIITNTFGANTVGLDCGWDKVAEIIESGWNIALKAADGTDVTVFADIGPIPHTDNVDNTPQYIQIVDRFLKLGANHFIFETFFDFRTKLFSTPTMCLIRTGFTWSCTYESVRFFSGAL